LGAGPLLASALGLPGCLGSGDGNPPRGSISAPRDNENPRKGDTDVGKNYNGARTKTKTRNGNSSRTPGGL
jgi:hypothetical protein